MFATVVTTSKSSALSSGLTYSVEDTTLQVGDCVKVPLRNSTIDGCIVDIYKDPGNLRFTPKSIVSAPHIRDLLPSSHISLAKWVSEYYLCSLRSALSLMLPGSEWSALLPQKQKYYRLEESSNLVRGSKQISVIEALSDEKWHTEKELRDSTGASLSTLRTLVNKCIISFEEFYDHSSPSNNVSVAKPTLSPEQLQAYTTTISQSKPTLLYGVTSSGKTYVYARCIADTIASGKQVILLLPEILLTEFNQSRFSNIVSKDSTVILHSNVTKSQKLSTWKKIRSGQAKLIIGSRSALFAPCFHLGAIIIDEEHEWTYKNEQTPRYNTRDVAEKLSSITGARLIFGSATPSLETWYKAKTGDYHLEVMDTRFGNAPLPHVRIVDLATADTRGTYPITPPLLEGIQKRLNAGEQSILFLNKRGYHSALLCLDCRRRVTCSESNNPYTAYTSANGSIRLVDHMTGNSCDPPQVCPHCSKSNLRLIGAGTQKVEHQLQTFFPRARIARADRDSLRGRDDISQLLQLIQNNEIDILIGTQTVVKGLDFPNVTLAAVLVADVGMSLPHFRASERSFQLLSQLTGRSGRAKQGEVILQTFRPDALEVVSAATHDCATYLSSELSIRKHMNYPPFSQMIRVIYKGDNSKVRANSTASSIRSALPEAKVYVFQPIIQSGIDVWNCIVRCSPGTFHNANIDLQGGIADVDPIECC